MYHPPAVVCTVVGRALSGGQEAEPPSDLFVPSADGSPPTRNASTRHGLCGVCDDVRAVTGSAPFCYRFFAMRG